MALNNKQNIYRAFSFLNVHTGIEIALITIKSGAVNSASLLKINLKISAAQ